jgi:membrane protein
MRYAARPRRWFGLRAPSRRPSSHPVLRNFFADRCPHLAAMVAYYALLSLVPFLFLLLSLAGILNRQTESSFLIRELELVLPGQSVEDLIDLVNSLRANARSYGVIGFLGLIWTSLGFLSAIESALNIIYDVPNRAFLRQKLLIFGLIGTGLVALFTSLVATTALYSWVGGRDAPGLGAIGPEVILSVVFSSVVSFVFLLAIYRLMPNTPVDVREVLPGAIFGTLAFQASFQALPIYLSLSAALPALKAFGGIVVLLVWLYLMGNVLLLGAQINWWHRARRREDPEAGLGLA